MKIFHCLRSFFPDNSAGTEIYVERFCKGLQSLDIEVAVLKPSFGMEPKEYIYHGIRVLQYLEISVPDPELIAGLKAPAGIENFKKVLLNEKPDAVHFHEVAGSNGITIHHVIAAKELGLPVFTTFHLAGNICMRNTFLYKNKYPCNGIIDEYKCSVCMLQSKGLSLGAPELISLRKKIQTEHFFNRSGKWFNYPLYVKDHLSRLKKVNDLSEKIFVLSNWYRSLLLLNGLNKNKIVVLPPAIPGNAESFAGKNKHSLPGKIRFVYAGRIAYIKGLHILLKALLQLKQDNWELDIFGPVFEKKYYESCKKMAIHNSSVRWKGVIKNDAMITTLAEYDAMIFPSIVQETMGLIMLESLAAGVPVIGSSIWSVEEQVEDGVSGLIFKTDDVQSLKNVLARVVENPSIIQKLSAGIKQPIDIGVVTDLTAKIYTETLMHSC